MIKDNKINELKQVLNDIFSCTDLKKESANSYCGPCPVCGGMDRFVLKTDTGKCWCRGCHEQAMDVIDFHAWKDGKTVSELIREYLPDHGTGHQEPRVHKPHDLFFKRGLSEEIINVLTESRGLKVTAHAGKQCVSIPYVSLDGETRATQYLTIDQEPFPFTVKNDDPKNKPKNKIFGKGDKPGSDCFFFAGPGPDQAQEIIVTESVINAMTTFQLFPYACSIALGGSTYTKKLESLKQFLPGIKKVIVCQDNDDAGDKMVKSVHNILGDKVHRIVWGPDDPQGLDINDRLQAGQYERAMDSIKNAVLSGAKNNPSITIPKGISAAELIKKEFPAPKWAVEGILPEGLNILGGKPKGGKSIMSMNLCLAIALGGVAFQGIKVERGTTIYLALEDTQRRLQNRLNQMLRYDPAPGNLHLFTEWPRLGEGGARALDQILSENPDTRLLVIDTLAKIRPPQKSNGNIYSDDYQVIGALKEIADKHSVSILVIHHLRKMESSDVFDTFSGSLGLTGAADGLMVLRRNGTGQTIFSLRGRDVEEQEYVVELDTVMMSWKITGKAVDVKSTIEKQTLYDCLKEASKPLSPKEIESLTGLKSHYIRKTLPTLLKEGTVSKIGRGSYIYINNKSKSTGNNGNNGNNEYNGNIGNNHDTCQGEDDFSLEIVPVPDNREQCREQCKPLNGKAFETIVPIVPNVPGVPDCSDEVTI